MPPAESPHAVTPRHPPSPHVTPRHHIHPTVSPQPVTPTQVVVRLRDLLSSLKPSRLHGAAIPGAARVQLSTLLGGRAPPPFQLPSRFVFPASPVPSTSRLAETTAASWKRSASVIHDRVFVCLFVQTSHNTSLDGFTNGEFN
jgi:hypothetical protein